MFEFNATYCVLLFKIEVNRVFPASLLEVKKVFGYSHVQNLRRDLDPIRSLIIEIRMEIQKHYPYNSMEASFPEWQTVRFCGVEAF